MAEISLKAIEDLCAQLARAEKVIEAARNRIAQGHNDTCSYRLLFRGVPCDCGHEALVMSLNEYDRPAAPLENASRPSA